jgi:hypothetical protein
MTLSPLDQPDLCIYVFWQIVFVYFANPICEFLDFFLDFLGRSSKPVILSHKHHDTISSRSARFVHYVFSQIVFVYFANPICEFFDFLGDFLGRGSKPVISSHKHHGAISSQNKIVPMPPILPCMKLWLFDPPEVGQIIICPNYAPRF